MKRILYLEDEQNIREVTQEYLAMKDYEVVVVVDGNEALDAIENYQFDVAILDIMVPHVSGLDVLAALSSKQSQCATIMLSALSDEKTQLDAFNRLADDYMIKPFSPLLLLKRIEAVLRRTHNEPVDDGLVINDDAYQAYYNQASLNLTVTEFMILSSMSKHPTRVYTRENLLDVIAPDDFMVSDRVIDAHIKNLRKKLPITVIKTVVGVGYQYEEVSL